MEDSPRSRPGIVPIERLLPASIVSSKGSLWLFSRPHGRDRNTRKRKQHEINITQKRIDLRQLDFGGCGICATGAK
jgi:hypothetical protein